jgi:hypothetical protein
MFDEGLSLFWFGSLHIPGVSNSRSQPMVQKPSPVSPFQEDSAMDFRPLAETDRRQLLTALRGNADRGLALLLDRKDTSFVGTAEDVPDEQVIAAVKSIPSHY